MFAISKSLYLEKSGVDLLDIFSLAMPLVMIAGSFFQVLQPDRGMFPA